MVTKDFDVVTLTLVFDPHIENFNHAYIFWIEMYEDFDISHQFF
jgi:hypothetical protein